MSSAAFENVVRKKYYISRILSKAALESETLIVENGHPVLKSIMETTQIDARTTLSVVHNFKINNITYHYQHPLRNKDVQIGNITFKKKNGDLYAGNGFIASSVCDFACMNGMILYSNDRGLFRYSPSSKEKHLLREITYLKLAVDEKNGVIYGHTLDQHIEKMDFCHPKAQEEKEPSSLQMLKARISKAASTFFREMKEYTVKHFEWQGLVIVSSMFTVPALMLGSLLGATILEGLIIAACVYLIQLTAFAAIILFEVLKHAGAMAIKAALSPP